MGRSKYSPTSAKASILGEAHQPRTVVGVLATGQIGIKPESQFEDCRYASAHGNAAPGGGKRAGYELEQRALAGTILTDDADRLPGDDAERDILEHGVLLGRCGAGTEPGGDAMPFAAVIAEDFG